MKKYICKIAPLITIMLVLVLSMPTYSKASDWITQGKAFITQGSGTEVISTAEVEKAVVPIATLLVAIGTVVLVIAIVVIGIKYMTCGSPDEKAKLKVQLIGLVAATIVIFGARVIWATLYNVMSST
ncbi:MAG: hypothetical protein LBL91_03090 [Lachnospiraceae bacterium]|jgi:hypothetical protein|nr:hypothetical protein [Lachnospiraceae bacterium]